MKKLSLKNFSILGLVLMGVSALTAAMVPSKSNATHRLAGDGKEIDSSNGGGRTVVFTDGGARSYTATGNPGDELDGLSATSATPNGLGTITEELSDTNHNFSGFGTSAH